MRIIFNSNVVHPTHLWVNGLPRHVETFCSIASSAGASLVVPRTTILEHEYHHRQHVDAMIGKLERAAQLFGNWKITVSDHDPRELVTAPDLVELLRSAGITVEVATPTVDDYQEAERRAALHLAPMDRDSKSDEMRDLVIWVLSIRLSKRYKGAMIVSNDRVHIDERGKSEAEGAGLLRARSLDEALEQLGQATPAGSLIRSVLTSVWDDLREAGLPLPKQIPPRFFSDLRFSVDAAGLVDTKMTLDLETEDGPLSARAHIFQQDTSRICSLLSDVTVASKVYGNGRLEIVSQGCLPQYSRGPAELEGLRRILGDT